MVLLWMQTVALEDRASRTARSSVPRMPTTVRPNLTNAGVAIASFAWRQREVLAETCGDRASRPA